VRSKFIAFYIYKISFLLESLMIDNEGEFMNLVQLIVTATRIRTKMVHTSCLELKVSSCWNPYTSHTDLSQVFKLMHKLRYRISDELKDLFPVR
jgi:hypothetical protein